MTVRDCTLRRQVSRILVSSMALASPAMAQEAARSGLEEVVVTAQRREESLQNAPLAITALSSETLELRGIKDFGAIAEYTPSMSFTPYPSSTNTLILYMRGQGVADSMQLTSDGSVALYQDGFYISRPQLSTFDLGDVERVEVLRGPQGTLYGRNTTGGAVNLISRKPSGELDFKQELSLGSRDYFRTLSSLNLPDWNGLKSKFTFLYSRKDGVVDNADQFSRDYQEEYQKGGRVTLDWDGGEAFTANYFFEIGEIQSTPVYYQVPALEGFIPGYTAQGRPADSTWEPIDLNLSKGDYSAHGLTLTWEVNDNLTIKSLTGYRELDSDIYQDYASAFSTRACRGRPASVLSIRSTRSSSRRSCSCWAASANVSTTCSASITSTRTATTSSTSTSTSRVCRHRSVGRSSSTRTARSMPSRRPRLPSRR